MVKTNYNYFKILLFIVIITIIVVLLVKSRNENYSRNDITESSFGDINIIPEDIFKLLVNLLKKTINKINETTDIQELIKIRDEMKEIFKNAKNEVKVFTPEQERELIDAYNELLNYINKKIEDGNKKIEDGNKKIKEINITPEDLFEILKNSLQKASNKVETSINIEELKKIKDEMMIAHSGLVKKDLNKLNNEQRNIITNYYDTLLKIIDVKINDLFKKNNIEKQQNRMNTVQIKNLEQELKQREKVEQELKQRESNKNNANEIKNLEQELKQKRKNRERVENQQHEKKSNILLYAGGVVVIGIAIYFITKKK